MARGGSSTTQQASSIGWKTPSGAVEAARRQNDLLDKRVKGAVSSQLGAKGHKEDQASPSFLIAYHIGSEDKVSVTDWGYRYGPGPWGYYGRDIDVRQYTEGTLVIDFVDASTKQLVWRGAATKAIDRNATQEQVDQVDHRQDRIVGLVVFEEAHHAASRIGAAAVEACVRLRSTSRSS